MNSWGLHSILERGRKFVVPCICPPKNMKLGIFTSQSYSDGKEMYQIVCYTCEVFFCLINLTIYLNILLSWLLSLLGAECSCFYFQPTFHTIEDIYEVQLDTDRGVKEKIRIFDTAGLVSELLIITFQPAAKCRNLKKNFDLNE